MKRFVFTLLLLIVLSLAVFMVGWVSLRLEPGSYAVMVSKTGGVDPEVLRSGAFRWTPVALLPTNLKLVSFTLSDMERLVHLGGTLPSAEIYKEFMAGDPDFSWTVSVNVRATVLPESLPTLVESFGFDDQAGLTAWLAGETDLAVAGLRAAIVKLAGTNEGAVKLMSGEVEAELKATIETNHPALMVRSLTLVSARVPDLALYESARALYLGYMENYRTSVEPALARASSQAAEEQVRMEILRRYGDLLERYPDLIDYLAIEAGMPPRQRAVIQTFTPPATATPTDPVPPAPLRSASAVPVPAPSASPVPEVNDDSESSNTDRP